MHVSHAFHMHEPGTDARIWTCDVWWAAHIGAAHICNIVLHTSVTSVYPTPSLSRICMTLRHIQEVHNAPSPLDAQMRQPMVLVARGLAYTHPSLCLPQSATTLWHLPTPESCKRYRANPVLTPDRGVYLFHITSTRLARVGMGLGTIYLLCFAGVVLFFYLRGPGRSPP